MRRLIPALVVTIAAFSSARAAPAQSSPFSGKSLGEGGGYKHPDADVGQFFEVKPAKPSGAETEKPAARSRPRPFAPVVVNTEPTSASEKSAPRLASAPAASGDGATLDSDSEDARRDYESRILAAAPRPARAGRAGAGPALAPKTGVQEIAGEGMLFVSLELDPQESGSLRDAVAGLGAAAAFRPDARFQPLSADGGSVRISGWLPASRLGAAILRPGVKRISVERGSRPAAESRLTGSYLVGLRVADAAYPNESVAQSVRDLTVHAGFTLSRVLGIETAPGGSATALVSGTFPVSKLSRALGVAGVLEIRSSPESPVSPAAPVASAPSARKAGFLRFVMTNALWLVLLTILLALPTLGGAVRKGLCVFVPYR